MAVLVTGGAGYIGSHMVWELLDNDQEVVVVDNLTTGFLWAIAPGVTFIQEDIGNRDAMEDIMVLNKIDAIIHFAGSVVVPESVENPLKYYENNTCNSYALIAAAVKTGVKRLIFSSTAAVYGNPPTDEAITENARVNPLSPYGTSKLMTEMMIRDTALAHNLSFAVLRYFNVAGCDTKGRTGQSTDGATHLIKIASETATGARASMRVFGTDYATHDGTCIRDYIHVNDLANIHNVCLNFLRDGGESFTANCGYGRGYSVLEVIDAVKRVSGVDFEVILDERRAGDPAALTANSDKLMNELKWKPKYNDLDQIVSSALEWEKKLPELRKPK